MTDWQWYWSSEAGRDAILRDEIEGLQAASSSAYARSARLSSQLAQLQGSLETRLSALSAAFDAYVELGDVRERLDGYPDSAAVRRDAIAVIDALSRGARPDPIEHRNLDYWLSYAVNAVIATVGGSRDRDAEQRATELSPDAELFMVAAAGALHAGSAVAERVPSLLVCDGAPTARQVPLWQSVIDGVYADVLPQVGEVWGPMIDRDPEPWAAWVRGQSGSRLPLDPLRWLDSFTAALGGDSATDQAKAPVSPAPPVPADQLDLGSAAADGGAVDGVTPDARAALRTLVITLVEEGTGGEAVLLERARTLRAKIENPTSQAAEADSPEPLVTVTEHVRSALLAGTTRPANRNELLRWVQPALLAATSTLETAASKTTAAVSPVRTDAGMIDVFETGAEPARVHRAEEYLAERGVVPIRRVIVPGAVAIALALLALGVALGGHAVTAWLSVVAVVIAAGVALNAQRHRRLAEQQRETLVAELHKQLDDGRARAAAVGQAQRRSVYEAAELAARLRNRLGAAAPV